MKRLTIIPLLLVALATATIGNAGQNAKSRTDAGDVSSACPGCYAKFTDVGWCESCAWYNIFSCSCNPAVHVYSRTRTNSGNCNPEEYYYYVDSSGNVTVPVAGVEVSGGSWVKGTRDVCTMP